VQIDQSREMPMDSAVPAENHYCIGLFFYTGSPLDTLDAMKSGQTSADIGGPDDCSGAHTRPKFYQNPSCVSRDTNVVVCLSPATRTRNSPSDENCA